MLDVFRIEAAWDGRRLVLCPVYGQGWELLAGERRPIGKRYTVACSQVSDVDSFNLEAVLYAVSRDIGDCWEQVRREAQPNTQVQLTFDGDFPEQL